MVRKMFNEDKKIIVSCYQCIHWKEELAGVFCYNRYGEEGKRVQVRTRTTQDICPNIELRDPKYIADDVKQEIRRLKASYGVKGDVVI